MTIRFFILQTHYRSTLDFSSEALVAAEKGLKRLTDANEILKKLVLLDNTTDIDEELDAKINTHIKELDVCMNDDFNTAKALANLFEMVPVINSLKDKIISIDRVRPETLQLMKSSFRLYMEDILGLKNQQQNTDILEHVMQLVIDIRSEAKAKKDFSTSDKIRKQLAEAGISLKDNKDGGMTWDLN